MPPFSLSGIQPEQTLHAPDGSAPQAPAHRDLQVGVSWHSHQYVRLTPGPCSKEEM